MAPGVLGDLHTGVVLQLLTEKLDGGVVLRKHGFDTVLYSYTRNGDWRALGLDRTDLSRAE